MNEEALIKQAQAGDAQAFTQLLEHYYDTLFAFAYKWCGNRQDAEDVAQQACVKLARSLEQYRFESSFSSWLYPLVINCAKDWQKSQARHQVHSEHPEEGSPPEPSHRERPHIGILIQQLLKKLEEFPEGMKETALLVHAEGFTHSETAKMLGVKESTISWRIHEIRKQLQPLFGQEDL